MNIVAHNQSIHTADLEPVIAGAKTSLERAGVLIRQTIGMANKHAGREAFHKEPRYSGILAAGGSAILILVGEFAGRGHYYPRLLSENGRMNPMNRPS